MIQSEARKLLNGMLPPFQKYKASVKANEQLGKMEEKRLLDIVVELEKVENGRYQETYDLDGALETIAKIAKKHENTMPFLIKQVLFYLCYKYLRCKRCENEEEKTQCRLYKKQGCCGITQGAFLEKLKDYQWPVSHNFFSRLGITPESYMLTKEHKQVNPPFPYPGQKKDELGYAIRYLAYQAGKYSKFVDVFGGSGAACSAIPKKDKVTYYYNEKNRFLENLFLVLADKELHQELITELEKIVGEIQGKVDEFDYYTNIDFEKEMKKYDNKRNKISDKEEKIRVENPTEFEMTYDEMWDFLQRFRQNLEEKEEDFVFVCNEYEYTKQELMKATETVVAFLTHYRVLIEYDEKYMKGIGLCKMMGNAEGKTTNLYDKNKEYIQHRCYCLYVYFSNLRREKKEIRQSDRVKCAAAEFYFLSFVTHGSTGVSPVLQMKKKEEEEAYSSVLKFLKTDFRKVIEAFHKEIQRVQCSQKDFHNMFQEHDDSNTLFYVDAPYIGTKDYIDLENEVEAFDKEQRDKLIVDITNAKGKVIFSCRATKNSKSKRRTQEELMAINKQIAIQILTLFCLNSEFGDRQWYALAIEKEKSLEQLLKENKIAEVMLTNFEIQSFEVEEKKMYVIRYINWKSLCKY